MQGYCTSDERLRCRLQLLVAIKSKYSCNMSMVEMIFSETLFICHLSRYGDSLKATNRSGNYFQFKLSSRFRSTL